MVTIKDVAKKAGVSIAIVSKAFNNYPDISSKTKKRILEIAKEMNYTPNIVAKNLSSKKPKTIGMITSGFLDAEGKDNSNSFDMFKGVYTTGEESQYELAIYLTDSLKQKQKSYAKFCQERNIGGAVLMGIRVDDPYFTELLHSNIPCVLIDLEVENDYGIIGSVSTDNVAAGYEIATYLLNKNHRDIVVIAGTEAAYVNNQRLVGVKKALKSFGIELSDTNLFYADFTEIEAYKQAKQLLETSSTRPTAFLCFSDLMAYGVMKAVNEYGLKIPDDISITGFDGLVINEYIQPSLTTVKQNFYEMGRKAALLLQQLIEDQEVDTRQVVEHQIVERESVRTL